MRTETRCDIVPLSLSPRVTADAVLLSQSNDLFEVLAPTESVSAGHNDAGGFFDLLLVHRGDPQLFSLAYIANNDEHSRQKAVTARGLQASLYNIHQGG